MTPPNPQSEPKSQLDAAIIRALATPPALHPPAAFAARVARRAVAAPQSQPSRWLGYGPRLALASGALLTVALFALAPHAAPTLTNPAFDAELLLLAELSALLLFTHRLLPQD